MLDGKKFSRGYRDATTMNILRKRLKAAFPEAVFTYGNITAADRKILKLEKSHANDAVAIAAHGLGQVSTTADTTYYRQLRKQKRSLHEATPRKGIREPNRDAKRNKKNTSHVGNSYLNDKVKVYGQTGWVSGFSGSSSVYVRDRNGRYLTVHGKNYKLIPVRDLHVHAHSNNWAVYNRKDGEEKQA
ncbi:hypothetical protein [Blautia faecicola]|uniref:HNH endonuclease n=1 Tax=Blautia faecicola TaxID=2509240 RepID=A0A4Q1RDC0_9FIRM|nr:hypothetical protein [Blautia faecicola]RXS72591.1 hypothetical protein ETP43_16570 [Blautia faecicola]